MDDYKDEDSTENSSNSSLVSNNKNHNLNSSNNNNIMNRVGGAGNGNGGAANGGQNGAGTAGAGTGAGGAQGTALHYTVPGILHFLQHEWSRFEMERSQWEVERAELQARIAFLQGERKGQENLKNDLVRRIKMLEYALKQERAKYHKLKFGADNPVLDPGAPPTDDEGVELPPLEGDNYIAVTNANWRQGRTLLRQYLQEIGFTDTIIDVRSNRLRSLLGLNDGADTNDENRPGGTGNTGNLTVNGGDVAGRTGNRGPSEVERKVASTLAEEIMMDTEASITANFEFLSSEADADDDDDMGDDDGDGSGFNVAEMKLKAAKLAADINDAEDRDTEEVMNEFNFLTNQDAVDSTGGSQDKGVSRDFLEGRQSDGGAVASVGQKQQKDPSLEIGNTLELGDLNDLTIANDNESTYDIAPRREDAFRKTWSTKYILRSHFDGVRALCFHPTEPVLITASEDQTLKLWNLQKTIQTKKSSSTTPAAANSSSLSDVEPVYTFRAHSGPVLSLAIWPGTGEFLYSGGMDATIRCWRMPSPGVDPYDSYDPSVLASTLLGHTDAVWGLSFHGPRQQLLSCSADATVKLWSPKSNQVPKEEDGSPLLRSFEYTVDDKVVVPTSVDWIYENPSHFAAAYVNAACVIYDVETGQEVLQLDTSSCDSAYAITKVVSHPTLPLTITASEDKQIRFYDNSTGKLTHAMAAHLDAVTSLSIDPNGLYLISGSHDCSIRLWNLETKTCAQEITAHRKKFDESIFDVAFHPSKPFIASAAADALAKVYI